MELSHTSHLILGMLRKGPKSGYEIKAQADISTRFFWAISYGQIYPELKRLDEAGLIEGVTDPDDGRQRRVYSITPLGEEALREWLTDSGELHSELRHEGVLRFFFADALDHGERVALLHSMRTKHEQLREELLQIAPGAEEASGKGGNSLSLLTLETGISYQEFFIELCDRLERRLAETDTESITGGS